MFVSLFLGLAYFLAYQYQKGVLEYYDIPVKFIDLSLVSIIDVFTALLAFLIILYSMLHGILADTPKIKSYKMKEAIIVTIIFITLMALNFVFISSKKHNFIIFTIFYSAYLAHFFIMPIVRFKGNQKYSSKFVRNIAYIERKHKKEKEFQETTFFYPYKQNISFVALTAIIIALVGGFFFSAGKSSSEKTEQYFVANDYNGKIIAYYNQDYYILMENKNGILKREYQIVAADEIGTIKKEKTGILKLENE